MIIRELRVVSCELSVTSWFLLLFCELRVVSCKLVFTFILRVASCELVSIMSIQSIPLFQFQILTKISYEFLL